MATEIDPAQHDPDVAVTFAATLLDQWHRRGVRHVVVSPGSRSTPLVIGLQWLLDRRNSGGSQGLQAHLVLDERSAAFQAVGIARVTGVPAVLICTSGTAAVEYHPAVVEAHQAALPMLVCTADRPPELLGTGAPQTIDQRGLYGGAVRSYLEPGPPTDATREGWRPLADDALGVATGSRPGPVHLNLGFREPLVGRVGQLPPPDQSRGSAPSRPAAMPPERAVLARLVRRCSGRRVLVVAGERTLDRRDGAGVGARALLDEVAALGWPVLADPLSGVRHQHPAVVANFDAILRSARAAEMLRAEVVIRLGALVSSKVTGQWLAHVPDQIAIDPAGWFPDPDRVVTDRVAMAPARFVAALGKAAAAGELQPAPQEWAEAWHQVGGAAEAAIIDERPGALEASALAEVLDGVPPGGHLVVSSSMPVRDLEWFGPPVPEGVTVHANRGANGIDGVLATAVGVARCGAPTVAVLGDLALLHDVGSLASVRGVGNLVVVVVDNAGGGIFSFLSQHELLGEGEFERWWGTPQGADLAGIVGGWGLPVQTVEPAELAELLRRRWSRGGPGPAAVFRVHSTREANLAQHRTLISAASEASEAALVRRTSGP